MIHQKPPFDHANWLSSKEAKKALKVSDCHLMHLRLSGKLQFRKEGNRYLYLISKQPEC